MSARVLFIGAVLALSVAYFLAGGVFGGSSANVRPPYVRGRNKTVLFLANKEHGISNVHVATASSLLENFPDIDVYYASFAGLAPKLQRVSSFARARTPAARDIVFHELGGMDFYAANRAAGCTTENTMQPPASAGIGEFTKHLQTWISPWSVDDHMALYEEVGKLIDELDPAVVVLDTFLRPAIDATRDKDRHHAFITPNTLVDNFLGDQPHGSMFWKYPAMASGFKFPVPLRDIPENIYLNMRFIYAAMLTPNLSGKKKELRARGLKDPINFLGMHRPDVPWITMNTEGASIPVDVVPQNVTSAGPILLRSAPAAEQDAELAAWMKKARVVLINLGSSFPYDKRRAFIMVAAILGVVQKTDFQVLWKLIKDGDYSVDDVLSPLKPYMESDRVRVPNWINVDPYALLETGDIVASVHHGGSNCYHEAIAAGVPHVILPLWIDLYNFAALVETLGVGAWGCKGINPDWSAEGISSAIFRVVDGGEESTSMRAKAKSLGEKVRSKDAGRDIAAREIAKLAYVK